MMVRVVRETGDRDEDGEMVMKVHVVCNDDDDDVIHV